MRCDIWTGVRLAFTIISATTLENTSLFTDVKTATKKKLEVVIFTMDKESVFDVLDGFKPVEVLEQNQNVLKTRFKNDKGDERIVTQTESEINIRWSD